MGRSWLSMFWGTWKRRKRAWKVRKLIKRENEIYLKWESVCSPKIVHCTFCWASSSAPKSDIANIQRKLFMPEMSFSLIPGYWLAQFSIFYLQECLQCFRVMKCTLVCTMLTEISWNQSRLVSCRWLNDRKVHCKCKLLIKPKPKIRFVYGCRRSIFLLGLLLFLKNPITVVCAFCVCAWIK